MKHVKGSHDSHNRDSTSLLWDSSTPHNEEGVPPPSSSRSQGGWKAFSVPYLSDRLIFLEESGVFLQKCKPHAGEDLISIFLKSGKTNEELNAMDCSVVARYVDDLCKSGTLKLWNFEGTSCWYFGWSCAISETFVTCNFVVEKGPSPGLLCVACL